MPWLIAGIVALIAVASRADADESRRRLRNETQRFREEVLDLSRRVADKEQELEMMIGLLGTKNEQVRVLAAEVLRLRVELDDAHRRAAVS